MTCRYMFQTHRSHVQSSQGPDSPLKKRNKLEKYLFIKIFFSLFFGSSWPGEKLQASEKVKHVFISLVNIGRGQREKCERHVLSNRNNKMGCQNLQREQVFKILYLIFSSPCFIRGKVRKSQREMFCQIRTNFVFKLYIFLQKKCFVKREQ